MHCERFTDRHLANENALTEVNNQPSVTPTSSDALASIWLVNHVCSLDYMKPSAFEFENLFSGSLVEFPPLRHKKYFTHHKYLLPWIYQLSAVHSCQINLLNRSQWPRFRDSIPRMQKTRLVDLNVHFSTGLLKPKEISMDFDQLNLGGWIFRYFYPGQSSVSTKYSGRMAHS